MRATVILLILVAQAAGAAACGEAIAAPAGRAAVEQPADRCNDSLRVPAVPPPPPFGAASTAAAAVDPRLAPTGAPAKPPDAVTRRASPARAVPLRL